jgi:hypothetical protein
MRRIRTTLLAIGAAVAIGFTAATPPGAASTLAVNWAQWLPSFVAEFDPTSPDDCVAGRDQCVRKTINDMAKRLDRQAKTCSHHAVFSLAYLRVTQGYQWIRETTDDDGAPHYSDKGSMNFVVDQFARAYLDAFDAWASGGLAPKAWQIAFDAAAANRATGSGDLLLGISGHINRDLAFVLAAAGLNGPDGSSRKPDMDRVNELLYLVSPPITAEEAHRFDDSMGRNDQGLSDPATFQTIVAWRERAWRNAEALVNAKSDEERELVAARIEATAAAEATLLLASNSYLPPLTTTQKRDKFCAANHSNPPPAQYPFAVN